MRLVGRPLRERVAEHERTDAFGVGRREQDAHRGRFRPPAQRGSIRPGGVHHGANVVDACLERLLARHSVRQTGAALVEADDPSEAGESLDESSEWGELPRCFEVRETAGHDDHVDRAVAEHLVGDVHVAAPGVLDRGDVHVQAAG